MEQHTKWVSIWGNAVSVAENRPERYARDITLRYPVISSFTCGAVRLTFDNYCGTEPITLNKVTVFYDGIFYPVLFNKQREVTIGAGDNTVSDPLAIHVHGGELLQVSFYLKDFTLMRSVVYTSGPLSEGLYANGDQTENPDISIETSRKTQLCYFLCNVSVLTDAEKPSCAIFCAMSPFSPMPKTVPSSATAIPSQPRTGPMSWLSGALWRVIQKQPSSAGPPPVPGFLGNTPA